MYAENYGKIAESRYKKQCSDIKDVDLGKGNLVLERIVNCIEDSVTAHEFTLETLGISDTPRKNVISHLKLH